MKTITVIKKTSTEQQAVIEPLSAFQIGQAKVKSQNALKTLEFYGEVIGDAEFQSFLRQRMSELGTKFPPLTA
jgi:hypothetical protein